MLNRLKKSSIGHSFSTAIVTTVGFTLPQAALAQERIVETVVDIINQTMQDPPYGEFPETWEPVWEGRIGENPANWIPPLQRPYGEDPATWSPNTIDLDPNSGREIRIQPSIGLPRPIIEARATNDQSSTVIVDANKEQVNTRQFPIYGLQVLFQPGKHPRIVDIDKDSAAFASGLRKGDQLILLNGKPVATAHVELSRTHDDELTIRLLRNSRLKSVQLQHKSEPDFGYFPASSLGLLAIDGGLKVVYSDGTKGLKRGDLIRSIDRLPIQSIAQFVDRVNQLQNRISVYFSRPGRKELFTTTLPVQDFQAFEGCSSLDLDVFGVTVENYFDFHRIVSIRPESISSSLGLESDDRIIAVNGKHVSQIADLIQEYENVRTISAIRGSSVIQFSPDSTPSGRKKAVLDIANFSNRPVQLLWKQSNGEQIVEKQYRVIPPNQSVQQPTFEGQEWAVRDSQTKDVLLEIVVESNNQPFLIPPDSEEIFVLGDSGATVKRLANRRLVITNLDEDSLATRSGLLVGDQLIKVNKSEATSFLESGESLSEDSLLTVLLQGQGAPIQIKTANPAIDGEADYQLPEWVAQALEENSPGGITVTQPHDGETPSIANLAAYHIAEETGESPKLQRVLYYGTQVVAGRNHYLVCEMVNPQSGEISVWNVEIYVDLNKKTAIKAIDRLR